MDNELLERIADALDALASSASTVGVETELKSLGDIETELKSLGDIATQLNLIKGELWEIAANTKSMANSQRDLVDLLANMSFPFKSITYPNGRFLRVAVEIEET